MSSTLWPINGTFSGRQLRQALGGFWGGLTNRPLGARSGVVPGTPSTTVTANATTYTVNPHCGVLDIESDAIAGPYNYAIDTAVTAAINLANASNDRIDLISVTMSDTSEGDGSTAGPTFVYTAGTAASSPVAPSTPAKSVALATIRVPKSGTGSPSVTWIAPYAVAAGGVLPVSGSSQYPSSPYLGQYVDDAALGRTLRWNGTAWVNANAATMQILSVTVTLATGSTSGTALVNFGRTYSSPPLVFVTTSINGSFHATAFGETTTQATVRVNRTDGGTQTSAGNVLVKVLVIDQSWT